MQRLTSADKGRTDGEASFRYSEENRGYNQWQSLLNSSLHLSTFRPSGAVDNSFLNVGAQGHYG